MASPRSDLEELQSRLRAAEERLRLAEIAGGIATFEHDFSTGAWTLSARFWNLLDREGSDPPTFEEVARSVFPDDLLKLQAAAEAARVPVRRPAGSWSSRTKSWSRCWPCSISRSAGSRPTSPVRPRTR